MSFGFGVGDVLVVGQLAWRVYQGCKSAPEEFKDISSEVKSLHAVLTEVEGTVSSRINLPSTTQESLKTVFDGCRDVLEHLQSLAENYKSHGGVGDRTKRAQNVVAWTALEDTTNLRLRLTSNTTLPTAILSYSDRIA